MIRATMAILLTLLLLISAGTVFGAEMAKEGSGDYRSGKAGTFEVLPMGQERGQMNFEELGVVVEAPEDSPLYNASFWNLGSGHQIKGKWKTNSFVVWTRPNGDQVYAVSEASGVMGGPSSAVLTFVGGTGTCAGIEGVLEIKGVPGIKSSKKGTWGGISVGKFNWKIP